MEDPIVEQWRDIHEFPLYEVSNLGYIRNKSTGRILKNNKNNFGNHTVALRNRGQTFVKSVARIVLTAFIGDAPETENHSPLHLDHDRSNCAAANLLWRPRWFVIQFLREWTEGPSIEPNTKVIDLRTAQVYSNAFEAAHSLGTLERFIVGNADLHRHDPEHYDTWSWYHE